MNGALRPQAMAQFTFALLLISCLGSSLAFGDDVECLRQFKSSVNDSQRYLASWDFGSSAPEICNFPGVTCQHQNDSKVMTLSLPSAGLSGTFPAGLDSCTSLTALDLSDNSFTGPIPEAICSSLLPYLVTLNLKGNYIGGPMPTFQNCTYLNHLDVSNNRLQGMIPGIIAYLQRLSQLDVSGNDLSGPVPSSLLHFGAASFAGNPKLCGPPINTRRCQLASGSGSGRGHWHFPLLVLLPACVLLSLAVLGVSIQLSRRHASKKGQVDRLKLFEEGMQLSEAEFYSLTENFSKDRIIGTGGSSTVYLGTLLSGQLVAVKKLNSTSEDTTTSSRKSFIRELQTLGKLRHRNLVRILGSFCDHQVMALLLTYMPNGSLDTVLHQSSNRVLNWEKRYNIALGVAQGLCYLHHEYGQPVVHCDLKPSNILLDEDFQARIADFGISKICVNHLKEASKSVMWTVGYSAPEVVEVMRLSPKADVFSFGILLMELLTRQRPCNLEASLRDLVQSAVQKEEVFKILDQELQEETQYHEEMVKVMKLALSCTQHSPFSRPDIRNVLSNLDRAQNTHQRFRDISLDVLARESFRYESV